MTANGSEKRKSARITFHAEVVVNYVQSSNLDNVFEVGTKPVKAKASDIAETGIQLQLGDTKTPSGIVKINFNVEKSEPIDAFAELAWKNGKQCGFRFVVLDKKSHRRLKKYIDKQQ